MRDWAKFPSPQMPKFLGSFLWVEFAKNTCFWRRRARIVFSGFVGGTVLPILLPKSNCRKRGFGQNGFLPVDPGLRQTVSVKFQNVDSERTGV
jgi:hypothetical protein